jgi:light-harvesting complex I chlorophyll a/b binding protein 1
VGFIVTEAPFKFHPLFETSGKDIGPAIRHLDEVRASSPAFFGILAAAIGGFEVLRALKGWEVGTEKNLKDSYYPGDIGFDPLGLKPKDSAGFAKMATKELNNGRLAMIAVAGFFAQELVNGKEIFVNLGLAPDTFDPSSLPIIF